MGKTANILKARRVADNKLELILSKIYADYTAKLDKLHIKHLADIDMALTDYENKVDKAMSDYKMKKS